MKKIFVPGKLILTGEHSVVYGYPALVASIDKGVSVTIKKGLGKVDLGKEEDPIGLVKKAVDVSGLDGSEVDIKIESGLPVASGLGSSAAVSAGVIKAVYDFLGKDLKENDWYELTMECERLAHENPSGVDPAAVIYGGLMKYIKGKGIERLVIAKPLSLLLFQSGRPRESTRDMVIEVVGKRMKREPKVVEGIFKKIGIVTEKIQKVLERRNGVGELFDENGKLLENLGVVGGKVRKISAELRKLDCGVKVTGAGGVTGGSGMMMVYHTDLDIPEKYLKEEGYKYMKVTVGEKSS